MSAEDAGRTLRQEITRTLVEQAFLGFLALDDAGKREFIERFKPWAQGRCPVRDQGYEAMSKIDDGGAAFPMPACSRCGELAVRRQGHQDLCAKHYRFGQMRAHAKRRGKTVPSHAELERLTHPENRCADCAVVMNWLAADGQTFVATLQHYRDGTYGIVCRSCNTRHAFTPGDTYRDIPRDHKFCPKCEEVKPDSAFSADNGRSGPRKLKSHCRECSHKTHTEWRIKNRDHYNAKQRENRARRSASA